MRALAVCSCTLISRNKITVDCSPCYYHSDGRILFWIMAHATLTPRRMMRSCNPPALLTASSNTGCVAITQPMQSTQCSLQAEHAFCTAAGSSQLFPAYTSCLQLHCTLKLPANHPSQKSSQPPKPNEQPPAHVYLVYLHVCRRHLPPRLTSHMHALAPAHPQLRSRLIPSPHTSTLSPHVSHFRAHRPLLWWAWRSC